MPRFRPSRVLAATALALACAAAPIAVNAREPTLTFTTLGTNSGPIASPTRSQPANLLRYGSQTVLVDVGDGAVGQLARSGVAIDEVQTLIISHLHFDHTGGLFALLGLRRQTLTTTPLAIYGPPGTRRMVSDLMKALEPGVEVSATIVGRQAATDSTVTVIEIDGPAAFQLGELKVSAVPNSHYDTLKENPEGHLSLSFRFDGPGRSILYTGDTGPSADVEKLCAGVDLLVSEIMDPAESIARLKAARPGVPGAIWMIVEAHFRREHLSPEAVADLARTCGAGALVLTHNAIADENLDKARATIGAGYGGSIRFARDLDSF